jgi:hypothetical protein
MTEPAAWGVDEGEDNCIDLHDLYFVQSDAQHMAKLKGPHAKAIPLYTAPSQREWVGLTDQEITYIESMTLDTNDAIRMAAVALMEKNT